jgi:hypothetical protein
MQSIEKIILMIVIVLMLSDCDRQPRKTVHNEDKVVATEKTDTMAYPTDIITVERERVHVYSSDDEMLRFYCWNTGEGGTCPDYDVVIQYRTESGKIKYVEDYSELAPWVNTIYTINKDDGNKYYLVVRSHRISNCDDSVWPESYAIKGDTLIEVSDIDGGPNVENGIPGVNYEECEWGTITGQEGYDWMYEYDAQKGNLYVPLSVGEYAPGTMTDRYLLYHFDGKKFNNRGEVAHREMHPSVQQYKRLLCFFRTKDYTVRVDLMADSTMRYVAWKAKQMLSEKPEVVIMGRKYSPDCSIYGAFSFLHQGLEYIVNYGETVRETDGHDSYHEYLIIKRKGTTIIKQARLKY